MLLSQDEARFALVPTLTATLGVKGQRPQVGTRDDKALVHTFASANVVDGTLTWRTTQSTQWGRRKAHLHGRTQAHAMQCAFAQHLHDVARHYPPRQRHQVVLVIDNAPWHKGRIIDAALRCHPHLKLYRLPPYSPQLQPIERLWKPWRSQTTHNVLHDDVGQLRQSVCRTARRYRDHPEHVLRSLGRCWASPASSGA